VILTDREIQIYLSRGLIDIIPQPEKIAYQSTSVDLRLDPVINILKDDRPPQILASNTARTASTLVFLDLGSKM
jgi:deoxycytidine triphosphate deaminase